MDPLNALRGQKKEVTRGDSEVLKFSMDMSLCGLHSGTPNTLMVSRYSKITNHLLIGNLRFGPLVFGW